MAEPNKEITSETKSDKELFTLFWHKESPFSQHHPSGFTIEGVEYNCAEQYMMHQKAVVFEDIDTAKQILETASPHKQKSLGRKVKNYNEEKWNLKCRDVVKRGNIAKFSQNEDLKQELFATAGTTLVEASPMDTKWGIGLGPDDPRAKDKKTWRGQNLLGQIITEVRDELMKKERV